MDLPPNVVLNNHPIYKVDLSRYAYGISAPSSVLLDMVLAGIPAAVWRDEGGAMDAANYEGLAQISTLNDWLDFSREAVAHPQRFIEGQQAFLARQQMPTDPADVYARFARLFAAEGNLAAPVGEGSPRGERVLLVANDHVTTLQVSFVKPFASLVKSGQMAMDFLTEKQMRDEFKSKMRDPSVRSWLDRRFALFRPTMVVFCRYSGPHAEYMAGLARREGIPVVFHIDDDLLKVPVEVGEKKHRAHNDPLRLATIRYLLDISDLVYCSTKRLRRRFEAGGAKAPLVAGKIYCAGRVLSPAVERPVRRIGCMGVDKAPDLEAIIPAVVSYLRRHKDVTFELFGSIPKPAALEEFGERVTLVPGVRNYEDFLAAFAKREWDIGICPLLPTQFNMVKANTKWVDYTSVGVAVVASRGTVYDECCADGCGLLAGTNEEWAAALDRLTLDPAERFAQVTRAQKRLVAEYSIERLRNQVLSIFAQARSHSTQTPKREPTAA
jgi:glycosyltransferase involved in cell wall biosynthesis